MHCEDNPSRGKAEEKLEIYSWYLEIRLNGVKDLLVDFVRCMTFLSQPGFYQERTPCCMKLSLGSLEVGTVLGQRQQSLYGD